MAEITEINQGTVVQVKPRARVKAQDPKMTRKGGAAHRGGIVVSAAALLFFAYVFDLGGLQGWVNRTLQGLDHGARSHNDQVAGMVKVALPYVASVMVVVAVFFLLNVFVHLMRAGVKKPKAKKKAAAPAVVASEGAPKEKQAPEPAVFVRPYRPPMAKKDAVAAKAVAVTREDVMRV